MTTLEEQIPGPNLSGGFDMPTTMMMSAAAFGREMLAYVFANTPAAKQQRRKFTWQEVKTNAERHCRSNPGWPGLRTMAKLMKCSTATMKKAIEQSATLRNRERDHKATKKVGGRTVQMTAGIECNAEQTRELAPDDVEAQEEVHASAAVEVVSKKHAAAWAKFVAKSPPRDREKLLATPIEQQKQWLAYEEDGDL